MLWGRGFGASLRGPEGREDCFFAELFEPCYSK
jgi:hypothetical protein